MVPVFPLVPDCWKKEESCLRYHSEAAFFFLEECVGDTMYDVKTVAVHVLCLRGGTDGVFVVRIAGR